MTNCRKCGNQIQLGEAFCENCGTPVGPVTKSPWVRPDGSKPQSGSRFLGALAVLALLVPVDLGVVLGTNYSLPAAYVGIDWLPGTYYLGDSGTWGSTYIFQAGNTFDSLLSLIALLLVLAAVPLYLLRKRRAAGSILLVGVLVVVVDYVNLMTQIPGYFFIPGALFLLFGLVAASLTKSQGAASLGGGVGKAALGVFLTTLVVLSENFTWRRLAFPAGFCGLDSHWRVRRHHRGCAGTGEAEWLNPPFGVA